MELIIYEIIEEENKKCRKWIKIVATMCVLIYHGFIVPCIMQNIKIDGYSLDKQSRDFAFLSSPSWTTL